jgi:hypothetical protein
MCESSSVSPSFSSESSCRRRLVYRDVVLVRRLFKYDDMVLRNLVSIRSREHQAVEVPLFEAFGAHALVGLCLEASGEGAVSSCSAAPKHRPSSPSEMSHGFLATCRSIRTEPLATTCDQDSCSQLAETCDMASVLVRRSSLPSSTWAASTMDLYDPRRVN